MEQNYIIVIALLFAFYAYKVITGRMKQTKLKKMMESDEGYDIIDVRTVGEYRNGHIPGAKNIPVEVIGNKMGKTARDRQIILYCQSGSRAAGALATLKSKGFTNAWNFGKVNNWPGQLEK